MDNIARIRQEIERRLKYTHDWLQGDEKRHPNQTFISKNYYKMKGDERTLDALLNFLDTLSEEPDKGLEEAAEEYTQKMLESWKFDSTGCRPPRESFKAGAEWQKERMLKEAVEGYVTQKVNGERYAKAQVPDSMGLKFGDKVRIIIVKEEEE